MASAAQGGEDAELQPRARAHARTRLLGSALLLLITAALGLLAYRAMFSLFLPVDDEGYVIVSLRLFLDGGALYDEVYSQYGPGFFTLVGGLIELIGLPLTSDGARFFNLAAWLGSTLAAGLVLLRITRSFAISVVGLLLTFFVLSVAANEPLHPGATIGLLLLLMVAAATFVNGPRPALGLGLSGAIGMALLSIKVNVGGFALVALAWASVAAIGRPRQLRLLLVAVGVGFVAVPWLLTADLLGDLSTQRYATLASAGALALILVSLRLAGARPGPRDLIGLLAGAGSVLALVVVVPLLGGTSLGDLIDGWVVRPSGTPERQFAPASFHELTYLWAFLGVAGALLATIALGARGRALRPPAAAGLGTGRIVFGLVVWLSLTGPLLGIAPELTRTLFLATPFVWIAAVAPPGSPFPGPFARVLICGLAVLQTLHAFPVGGSQLAWSQFLFVIVGAICIADGMHQLRTLRLPDAYRGPSPRAITTVAVVAVGVWLCVGPLRDYAERVDHGYDSGVALRLEGAERLRLGPAQAAELRGVVASLESNCQTFISLPGLNSFYLFAEMPPPTVLSGPWPHFLTADEQREIVDQVEQIDLLCAVRRPQGAQFWAGLSGFEIPRLPLVRFFEREFETIAEHGGYLVEGRRASVAAGGS